MQPPFAASLDAAIVAIVEVVLVLAMRMVALVQRNAAFNELAMLSYTEGLVLLQQDFDELNAVAANITRPKRRRGANSRRAGDLWREWNDPINNSYWETSSNPRGKLERFRTNLRLERKTFDFILS